MNHLQEIIRNFCIENNMNSSTETRFLDLTSEVGEVGKEILKSTNYGNKPFVKNKDFELEVGDLLFSLLALANSCEIDISDALFQVLEKYKRRLKKGSAGSEND